MKQFAPAKLNLFLHILGRRADGYHDLQSLVCFADVGDNLHITPAADFKFEITGPYAHALSQDDNLVIDAARWVARHCDGDLNVHITLEKNLPVSAGIGGGSSDAAAVIRGLLLFWDKENWIDNMAPGTCAIGADVPVCMTSRPALMEGVGDILSGVLLPCDIPAVLVNPLIACSTAAVFKSYAAPFSAPLTIPECFEDYASLISFLDDQQNDLEPSAIQIVPEIVEMLQVLEKFDADLVRLSGSGATCFGLFETCAQAENAAKYIQDSHPHWWVKNCLLNVTTP